MITRIRSALFGDLRTKGMAAVLSAILWFYVNAEYVEESPAQIARLALDVPEGVLVLRVDDPTGREVDQVSVVLKGPKGNVKNLTPRDLVCKPRVILPEKGLEAPMVLEVQLGERDFDLPPGLRATVVPATIRIALAPETEQMLRIRTADCTTGKPEEGFRVAKVDVTPTHVRVRGPRHILKGRSEISIAKIDVSQARASFTQRSRIQPTLDNEKVYCSDTVTASVVIEEEPVLTTFTGKVYVLLPATFPHRFEPRPAEVAVRLRVPRAEMANLNEKNVLIIADPFELYSDPASQMQPGGSFKVPLRIRVREGGPRGIQFVEAVQEFVLYLLPEEKQEGPK